MEKQAFRSRIPEPHFDATLSFLPQGCGLRRNDKPCRTKAAEPPWIKEDLSQSRKDTEFLSPQLRKNDRFFYRRI